MSGARVEFGHAHRSLIECGFRFAPDRRAHAQDRPDVQPLPPAPPIPPPAAPTVIGHGPPPIPPPAAPTFPASGRRRTSTALLRESDVPFIECVNRGGAVAGLSGGPAREMMPQRAPALRRSGAGRRVTAGQARELSSRTWFHVKHDQPWKT
jgi:hypothetical protein